MSESKIGDHAEFKDEDVEGHNERSKHAVTSRYNLVRGFAVAAVLNTVADIFHGLALRMFQTTTSLKSNT